MVIAKNIEDAIINTHRDGTKRNVTYEENSNIKF